MLGELSPGTVLHHTYRIEDYVDSGGMGAVYRARHTSLKTLHAIKLLRPDAEDDTLFRGQFQREAFALSIARHDGIVGYETLLHDDKDRQYLVMEYVEGPSLARRMRQRPLSIDEVRRLRDRLAGALQAMHDKGITHRDVAPDNVILADGRIDGAKIIDFGIVQLTHPEHPFTIAGDDFVGKYSYASPEQLGMNGGKVDARSDIYSLGLVLAAASIGKALPMGMYEEPARRARRAVPDLSSVPVELRGELAAMLQPDPIDRPESASAIMAPEAPAPASSAPRAPVLDAPEPGAPEPEATASRILVSDVPAPAVPAPETLLSEVPEAEIPKEPPIPSEKPRRGWKRTVGGIALAVIPTVFGGAVWLVIDGAPSEPQRSLASVPTAQETTAPQQPASTDSGETDIAVRSVGGTGELNRPPAVAANGERTIDIGTGRQPLDIAVTDDEDGDRLNIIITAVPQRSIVWIGDRELTVGDAIEPSDLRLLEVELPADAFDDIDAAFPETALGRLAYHVGDGRSVGSLGEVIVTARLNACDRLAGSPLVADGVGPGTAFAEVDPARAVPACSAALEHYPDVVRFSFQLGRAQHLAENYEEARQLYRAAADQGSAGARHNLGRLHQLGLGVPQSDDMAAQSYGLAAEQGLAVSQLAFGWMYEQGRGVLQDDAEAVHWYTLSSDQGYAPAWYHLGRMYENGRGVDQDDSEAVRLYRLAADQGSMYAQYRHGWMHENGRGVPEDHVEAVRWYRRAAEQGYAEAQYHLGRMYEHGRGVDQDDTEAVRWYRRAAEQGNTDAQESLDRLCEAGRSCLDL